jgi:hypothetical protein
MLRLGIPQKRQHAFGVVDSRMPIHVHSIGMLCTCALNTCANICKYIKTCMQTCLQERCGSYCMLQLRGGEPDALRPTDAKSGNERGGQSTGEKARREREGGREGGRLNMTSAAVNPKNVKAAELLSFVHTREPVELPSLDSFNISDETSVLRVKLALAQAEITKLKVHT